MLRIDIVAVLNGLVKRSLGGASRASQQTTTALITEGSATTTGEEEVLGRWGGQTARAIPVARRKFRTCGWQTCRGAPAERIIPTAIRRCRQPACELGWLECAVL
jgi:hypothetical protein